MELAHEDIKRWNKAEKCKFIILFYYFIVNNVTLDKNLRVQRGRNGVIIFIGTMPELWRVPVRWFCNLCHVNDAIMRVYAVIKYMAVGSL